MNRKKVGAIYCTKERFKNFNNMFYVVTGYCFKNRCCFGRPINTVVDR